MVNRKIFQFIYGFSSKEMEKEENIKVSNEIFHESFIILLALTLLYFPLLESGRIFIIIVLGLFVYRGIRLAMKSKNFISESPSYKYHIIYPAITYMGMLILNRLDLSMLEAGGIFIVILAVSFVYNGRKGKKITSTSSNNEYLMEYSFIAMIFVDILLVYIYEDYICKCNEITSTYIYSIFVGITGISGVLYPLLLIYLGKRNQNSEIAR